MSKTTNSIVDSIKFALKAYFVSGIFLPIRNSCNFVFRSTFQTWRKIILKCWYFWLHNCFAPYVTKPYMGICKSYPSENEPQLKIYYFSYYMTGDCRDLTLSNLNHFIIVMMQFLLTIIWPHLFIPTIVSLVFLYMVIYPLAILATRHYLNLENTPENVKKLNNPFRPRHYYKIMAYDAN